MRSPYIGTVFHTLSGFFIFISVYSPLTRFTEIILWDGKYRLESVLPDHGVPFFNFRSMFKIFEQYFLRSFFHLPPNIPENLVDLYYVLAKLIRSFGSKISK